MLPELESLLPHAVQHAPVTGRDKYGQPKHGPASIYKARVAYRNKIVRGREGDEVTARGVVWINGTPAISFDDKLTLPDGSTPKIVSFDVVPDERGPHHARIYFA